MKNILVIATVSALTLSTSISAQEGKAVYNKACQVCHAMGVAGAPKTHDTTTWAPLLEQGIDALLLSVKNGKGGMPAGGMCADCTDDDYKNAIKFMSEAASQ